MKLWLPTMQNRRAALRVGLVGIAFISLVGCTTGPALREADPAFARKEVTYPTPEPPGTVIVDPGNHFLYLVQGCGKALRYGVGVGAEGFVWSGRATINAKQEWP